MKEDRKIMREGQRDIAGDSSTSLRSARNDGRVESGELLMVND
jgi:hypothetical protein